MRRREFLGEAALAAGFAVPAFAASSGKAKTEGCEASGLVPGGEYVQQVRAKVLEPVDVVVAGGGTAGVIAALAAAHRGAKTMLIEGRGFLGGMLTDWSPSPAARLFRRRSSSTVRGTVQCMVIGEAAGTAAAMAVKKGVALRGLDYGELRSELKKNGALC